MTDRERIAARLKQFRFTVGPVTRPIMVEAGEHMLRDCAERAFLAGYRRHMRGPRPGLSADWPDLPTGFQLVQDSPAKAPAVAQDEG